ncbi:alanine-synthesizing transaminase [Pontibacter ummariensis]|uniref:Aminotransferase n=1 Tax=Pontibacter ummariensis TaxID=1610492 RepID=A0A239FR32_9BACT|nr:pyridoxal phosphate-dependent aminotransferase [Pontibacter ummariensis]PRY11957.1 alanine-synthesizing transaminase [Pontibacter ummariensis]SNS59397.1 alanine-synthesizing transaminase [Pontibacter ummariensis]
MIQRSDRLQNVSYELRGPVYEKSKELELQGHQVTKLNIGNPAPFGFSAPQAVLQHIVENLSLAQGYSDHKGLLSAREAVKNYYQDAGVPGIHVDDIFLGNGLSELIMQSVQALVNNGDEVLVPSPDYPLWTAAVNFSGGKAVHYLCDEESGWSPDVADMRSKITNKTRAVVVINPNNPTGAVYSREILTEIVKLAEEHELIIFSDEIYDRILYDQAVHIPTATLTDKAVCITMSGLSKNYLAAGFRAGWMLISGAKSKAADYIDGLNTLASLRVCSNVPAQYAIKVALEGVPSVQDLVLPTGRLGKQRALCYEKLTAIPGITCVKPMGAFYMFPKVDTKKFDIHNDQQLVIDLLAAQHVFVVQGSGFNWHQPDHFRVVYLPDVEVISDTMDKLSNFFSNYKQAPKTPAEKDPVLTLSVKLYD